MKKLRNIFPVGVGLILIGLTFLVAQHFHPVFSSELTNASATLTNARLSFVSALNGTQTAGSSLIKIRTTGFPSSSVLQLQNRDVVNINNSTYTVATTIDDIYDDTINLTSAMQSDDIADGTLVVATQSSSLTVRFTTISALTGGKFRVLVPAGNNNSTASDQVPDPNGFDFGDDTTASITCPATFPSAYGTFTATNQSAQSSGIVMNGVPYHVFTCSYTGNGEVGTNFDGTTNSAFTISNLVNPSPKISGTGHTYGTADTYAVIIQHLDSAGTVVDQTTTKVGVVDAVKVSASIAPQLTFTIAGISSGTTACGVSTTVTTTALTVPFGDLTLGQFSDAAQLLTVSTNASAGYSVTVLENDQLGRNGNVCATDGSSSNTCIVDASAGMTHTTSADWTSATSYPGFGYSLDQITVGIVPAFTYNESGRTYSAKQFADLGATEAPQTIFTRNTVASGDQMRVCYRLSPAVTNVAGDYENYLVYTASATF